MGFFRVADWIGRIIPVFKSQRLYDIQEYLERRMEILFYFDILDQ